MCGQFLTCGDINKAQDNFISDMFILDSIRGPHSCGLTAVPNFKTGELKLLKKAIPAHDYVDLNSYTTVLRTQNKVLIGHNRWATKGKINSINAHPFTIGDITGQHNGTLIGQWRLPDNKDFAVDSENIIHAINKIGIKDTWALVEGAAALIWWDAKQDTVNFIRNKERPLYFCYSSDLKQMYAASEYHMLQAALWRNGIKYNKIEELPINTLYSFKINTLAKNAKEVVKCSTTKLEPFRPKVYEVKPYTGKKKGLGKTVDFYVESIEHGRNSSLYTLVDNEDEETYYMEVYYYHPQLKIKDFRRGKINRVAGGKHFIDAYTITDDSLYEWTGTNDDEEPFVMTDTMWKRIRGKCCDWCGDPLQKKDDIMETSEGQLFCSTCKENSDVAVYTSEIN